ncbi:MAG: efflux RND transporter periplasmic adaptor subunit [Candidatus Aminicenantaceae bacterium]
MKSKYVWKGTLIAAVTAAICLYSGCGRQDSPSESPAATVEPANASEGTAAREAAAVVRRDIEPTIRTRGIIKPSVGSEVKVGSRVSGIVSRLHVKTGDRVTKGQLLAELDPTELQAQLNQAEATLNNARAQQEYARLDVERKRTLFQEDLVSQNELDRSERTYEVAASSVQQAVANLDYARIQVRYATINAPISGVVASVTTQEGETVAASFSAPTFVTIIDLDRLEVWAYVDETDIGRTKVGQKAIFGVETYSGTNFEGTVTTIYPKAEILDGGVKYVTILQITRLADKPLRPEMSTRVMLLLEKIQNALVVPNEAIHRGDLEKFVYVLQGGSPIKRVVQAGAGDGEVTVILDGLAEGDQVIIGDIQD